MSSPEPQLTLEELLAPLSVSDFVARLRSDAFTVAGDPSKLAALFSRERCFEAVASGPAVVRATYRSARGGEPRSIAVPLPSLGQALEAGGTLSIPAIDALEPSLATLGRSLERALGYPGRVRFDALVAPAGGLLVRPSGVATTLLQIAGASEWTHTSAPDVVLRNEAGALCHFPPSGLASGTACDPCVIVMMVFQPLDFAELLERLIWRENGHAPEWRNVLPLLANKEIHGGPHRSAMDAIDARIDDLTMLISRWRGNSQELLRAVAVECWPAQSSAPTTAVGEDTPLTLAPSLLVVRSLPDDCVVIAHDTEVETSGPTARVLQGAMQARQFRASTLDVPGLPRAVVVASVIALAEAGVFHEAGAASA